MLHYPSNVGYLIMSLSECRFWEHHWVWWTAPFIGAALAAKLYVKYVMPKDQLKELRTEVANA